MKRLTLTLTVWLLASLPALAIQQRTVEILMPRGGSRGTTVEVLLQGMDLADPEEIIFYRGGITATDFKVLPPLQHPISLFHRGEAVEQVKVRFTIAPDCPLGEHPLRLRTANTLSTLCTFWVSPFPMIDEQERTLGENDTPQLAQSVPLNSTVAGKINEGRKLDLDLYRVELQAGQRLAVEVESLRLSMYSYGDAEYDLMALLLDEQGRELARNDDSGLHIQDPVLSFVAPESGSYYVEVRQRLYKPHNKGHYQVHIGDFARPLAAYPLGGPAGQPLTVRLLGDAAGETTQAVSLPAGSVPTTDSGSTSDNFPKCSHSFNFYPGPAGHQPPSPLVLRSSPYPNSLESEPNNAPAEATKVSALPQAINGIIETNGDVDYFQLPVTKGETYRIRVFARTLGTPLDPKIWLFPIGGSPDDEELEADDAALRDRDIFGLSGTMRPKDLLDPSVVFAPKRDGDYLLGIGDTRGLGGSTYAYRVEIEPVSDSVFVYTKSTAHDAFETNRVTGFIVPQGNRWTLNLSLEEGQGNRYKGDLKLEAHGLPAGVQMIAPLVTGGMRLVPVQFVADASARPQAALIEIVARPVQEGVELVSGSQQGIPFVNHSGGHAWNAVSLDRFALAVTQPVSFHVELVQPQIALSQSGELTLTVKLVRHGDFNEPIDIQPEWLPTGVGGQSAVTIEPGQTEARFLLNAASNASPGQYKVAMNATTTGGLLFYSGVGRRRVSSKFIDLTVGEPYLTMNIHRTAVERGSRAEIVCDVKHLKPFFGQASACCAACPTGSTCSNPCRASPPAISKSHSRSKPRRTCLSGSITASFVK